MTKLGGDRDTTLTAALTEATLATALFSRECRGGGAGTAACSPLPGPLQGPLRPRDTQLSSRSKPTVSCRNSLGLELTACE